MLFSDILGLLGGIGFIILLIGLGLSIPVYLRVKRDQSSNQKDWGYVKFMIAFGFISFIGAAWNPFWIIAILGIIINHLDKEKVIKNSIVSYAKRYIPSFNKLSTDSNTSSSGENTSNKCHICGFNNPIDAEECNKCYLPFNNDNITIGINRLIKCRKLTGWSYIILIILFSSMVEWAQGLSSNVIITSFYSTTVASQASSTAVGMAFCQCLIVYVLLAKAVRIRAWARYTLIVLMCSHLFHILIIIGRSISPILFSDTFRVGDILPLMYALLGWNIILFFVELNVLFCLVSKDVKFVFNSKKESFANIE